MSAANEANFSARCANAERVRDAFLALRGKVPGLDYAHHPEHLRAKQAAGDLRIERHQVDCEITSEGTSP